MPPSEYNAGGIALLTNLSRRVMQKHPPNPTNTRKNDNPENGDTLMSCRPRQLPTTTERVNNDIIHPPPNGSQTTDDVSRRDITQRLNTTSNNYPSDNHTSNNYPSDNHTSNHYYPSDNNTNNNYLSDKLHQQITTPTTNLHQQQLLHQQPQQHAPPTGPPQQHTHTILHNRCNNPNNKLHPHTSLSNTDNTNSTHHSSLINKRDPRLKEHRHQDARVDTQTPSTNPTPFSTYNTPVTKTPLLPNPTPFSTINTPSRKTPLLTLPPAPTTAPSSSHPTHSICTSTPESPSKRNAVSITCEEFRREVARVIAQLFPGGTTQH
ncbi:myb-like protein M [Macrobrachium rosenbergii]|uniref:myb-like protein M n=1 Tax=Macrobrachium rosenbergii TaxID=79674 RepID=UPI0034D63277